MHKHAGFSVCLLSLLALALVRCAGGGSAKVGKVKGDRELVSHSEGVEPLWIQECPARTDHILPFCGVAHEKASRKMACAEAYADALGKLRRSIGQKVDAKLVSDGKGGYSFEIQGASQPMTLRGVWEDQNWYEEYQGPLGRTFDCYIMLVYPRLEYENLLGMARKAARDKVAKASELLEEARRLAADGRHADAVVDLKRASGLLASLKEPVVTPDGSVNSTLLKEQVVADLKKSQGEASRAEKTALVVLRLVMDGRPAASGSLARSVLTKVKGWLMKKGIRCRPGGLQDSQVNAVLAGDRESAARAAADKGAGLLAVVDIETEFLSREEGVFYAQALGSFRLIRTADGRELAAVDLGPEKQGHPASRRAVFKLSVEKLRDKALEKAVCDSLKKI